jgi:hypothetical protein
MCHHPLAILDFCGRAKTTLYIIFLETSLHFQLYPMPPKKNAQKPQHDLYKFHYRKQLPVTETRLQRKARLDCVKTTEAEVGNRARLNQRNIQHQDKDESLPALSTNPDPATDERDTLGFNEGNPWEDVEDFMNEEDAISLARIRSLNQQRIQQQKNRNWIDVMEALFPVYLYLKKRTSNWTLSCALEDFSSLVCNCSPNNYKIRQVDLVDLMGREFIK